MAGNRPMQKADYRHRISQHLGVSLNIYAVCNEEFFFDEYGTGTGIFS
jgi:hypothetical protein